MDAAICLPQGKAPHTFYLQTDGAVRLTLKVDGTERVLIDQPGRHACDGARLASRSRSIRASSPRSASSTATRADRRRCRCSSAPARRRSSRCRRPSLYPADGLSSFAPVEQSYRRLHKAALILTGFGVTDAQLEWLTGDAAVPEPRCAADGAAPAPTRVALFRRWRQLAGLYALRKKLPRSNVDLFDVFRAPTMADAIDRLVLATGWDRGHGRGVPRRRTASAIDSVDGLRPPADAAVEPAILRLARAIEVQRRVGVAPATLYVLGQHRCPTPTAPRRSSRR